MEFIINFLKGLAIGAGAVAPGVSGGSLAVIFRIYDKLTNLIANFFSIFKDFKKNLLFFFPIGLGGLIGVIGFSRVMDYLFANYNAQVKYLFIGLMAGTLPSLVKQSNQQGFKKNYILPLILAFGLTIYFTTLDEHGLNAAYQASPDLIRLMIYGAILGFGTIVPGISASFILMYLGAYELILKSIAELNLATLIPLGIGFALSIVLFAKLINLLFKKAYGYTSYTVLGLVAGSMIPIFPGFAFSATYLLCTLLLLAGFLGSYSLCRIQKD